MSNTRNIFSTVREHDWDEEYDVEIAPFLIGEIPFDHFMYRNSILRVRFNILWLSGGGQICRLPSLRLFMTTVTLERAIAPAAMAGWRSLIMAGTQVTVWSTPAASGTRAAL